MNSWWKFFWNMELLLQSCPRYTDNNFALALVLLQFEIYHTPILNVTNDSSSLNKGNHDCDSVWISDLNQQRFLRFYFSVFSLTLVSIEKICQTLKTVFCHISTKQLKFHQIYSIVNALYFQFSSRCLEMWSNTVFHI